MRPANCALKAGLPRHNRRQSRRSARRDTRQPATPRRRPTPKPAARRRSPKSLPTLANTFSVKMPFSCATMDFFKTAFPPLFIAVSVVVCGDCQKCRNRFQIPSLAPYFYWGFAGSEVFASVLHQQKTPRPLILLPRTGRFPRRFFVHFPRCVRQVFTPKIPALSRRTFTKKP